jgi:hypothetical protein
MWNSADSAFRIVSHAESALQRARDGEIAVLLRF